MRSWVLALVLLAGCAAPEPASAPLSVGADQGVERGFHFSVYRGSSFVGKVVVERVLGDLSGARVLFVREGMAVLEDSGWRLNGLAPAPMPDIVAHVAAVKTDVTPSLVLLDVGARDGVEKGFHFCVYRGSEFVGKVVVEKVLSDSSGCRVLFTKDGASICAGDAAATRLQ